MKKFVYWFTGPVEGIVEKHQANSIVYFLLLILGIIGIIAPFGTQFKSEFPFVITFLLIATLLLVYKFTKSSLLVGNLTTAVAYAAIFQLSFKSGGIYSLDLAGLFIIPMVAFNLAGNKSGIFWTTLCLTPIILHYYYAQNPIQSTIFREQTLAFETEYYLAFDIILLLFPVVLILLFISLNSRLIKLIKSRNNELDKSNEKLATQKTQLINTKEKLEESNKLLKKYAHATSHDLKQPIRTIASFTQLLKRELQKSNHQVEKVNEYLNQIEEGSIRMNSHIGEILNFANKPNIDIDNKIDVKQTIDKVIADLAFQIGDEKVQINIAELPKIKGIEANIYKIFQNLISNAIKYKDHSRDLIINIYGSEKTDLFTFCINDNGMGIKANKLNKIFKFGEQISSKIEGKGIGLDTVKTIIENKGGKIWVESKFGVGSTFYFTYPKYSD